MNKLQKILIIAFFFSVNTHAVLLTNGAHIPYAKVKHVYDILKTLEKEKCYCLLADLYRASKSKQLNPDTFVLNDVLNKKDSNRMQTAIELGLCDKTGALDTDTAHIINSSISTMFKAPRWVIYVTVKSPISWKNYFSLSYWKEKA